jgi:PAS domain-containing protein
VRLFGPEPVPDRSRYELLAQKDGVIIGVSETAPTILGYSMSDLYGMRIGELAPYVRSGVPAFSSQSPLRTALRYRDSHRTKEGIAIAVEIIRESLDLPNGSELYICTLDRQVGLVRDAADQVSQPHELVAEIDRAGRCTYASDTLASLMGIDSFVLLGANFIDFLDTEAGARCRISLRAGEGNPFVCTGIRFAFSGSPTFRLHAIPLRHDDGSMHGHTLVFEREDLPA